MYTKQSKCELADEKGYEALATFKDERGHSLHALYKDGRYALVSSTPSGHMGSFCALWPLEIIREVGKKGILL
jgi:hypothetical protein